MLIGARARPENKARGDALRNGNLLGALDELGALAISGSPLELGRQFIADQWTKFNYYIVRAAAPPAGPSGRASLKTYYTFRPNARREL